MKVPESFLKLLKAHKSLMKM